MEDTQEQATMDKQASPSEKFAQKDETAKSGTIPASRDCSIQSTEGYLDNREVPVTPPMPVLVEQRFSAPVIPLDSLADSDTPIITLTVTYDANYGEFLVCTGSATALGSWNPSDGVYMEWTEGNVWRCEIPAAILSSTVEYKFVVASSNGYHWESGANRTLTDPIHSQIHCTWQY
jgi:hypothetical protein